MKAVSSPNLFDRALAYFAPVAAAKRAHARNFMALAGGYNGGARDRRSTRNWRMRERSANEEISPDLADLRARSRDLNRNTPIAAGATETMVTNVVGDGLVLQSLVDRSVLGLTEEQASAKQAELQREFMIWQRGCDFRETLTWDEMQAMVLRSVIESGDLFVVRRKRQNPWDTYGLKLQLIEADRISNPDGKANSTTLVDGVALSGDGVPTGYHISSRHAGDMAFGKKREWRFYAKGYSVTGTPLILHLFHQKRPDQARGVPFHAPVIEALKQLGDYTEAEAIAAVTSAMFTVFVKPKDMDPDNTGPLLGEAGGDNSGVAGNEMKLGPGAVIELAPGDEIEQANPMRPNAGFEQFINALCQQIGVALGLPYEILLQRFTASYSASRAALEMAWQTFRLRRSWLAWKFCQPCYEWVVTEAVASGRISLPGFFTDPVIREAWLGAEWIGPSRIQLDPLKEANADRTDLDMGVKTRAQIIMERTGGSFETKHEQLAREERMRRRDGLGLQPAPAATAMPEPEAAAAEPA